MSASAQPEGCDLELRDRSGNAGFDPSMCYVIIPTKLVKLALVASDARLFKKKLILCCIEPAATKQGWIQNQHVIKQ